MSVYSKSYQTETGTMDHPKAQRAVITWAYTIALLAVLAATVIGGITVTIVYLIPPEPQYKCSIQQANAVFEGIKATCEWRKDECMQVLIPTICDRK